jgi:hypothetical protein
MLDPVCARRVSRSRSPGRIRRFGHDGSGLTDRADTSGTAAGLESAIFPAIERMKAFVGTYHDCIAETSRVRQDNDP